MTVDRAGNIRGVRVTGSCVLALIWLAGGCSAQATFDHAQMSAKEKAQCERKLTYQAQLECEQRFALTFDEYLMLLEEVAQEPRSGDSPER